jgi:alkylated DNA nucleotide flippase Atl1
MTTEQAREQIRRAAALVPAGRWTTNADISLVVYGHRSGGQAIGQTMLRRADFPNAWRVLHKGGRIPADWRHTDGSGGPGDCADALRAEGVMILTRDDGVMFADPDRYVDADELAQRQTGRHSRDAQVRRVARRRGYNASRSRVRDPRARGYGRWTVKGPEGGQISPERGWTLDQVEAWLAREGEVADAEAQAG